MQLNEITYDGPRPIDAYGPGFFRVGGALQNGPLGLLPDRVFAWGGLEDVSDFIAARADFDVLFIGMGAEIAPLPADLRAQLDNAGVGVEIMGTASACRTYNILLSEGRRVAAALLPV
jgi:uncharacterized protein